MESSSACSWSIVRSSFFKECSSLRMSARILLPSLSKWTRPPVPRTNWYASATATHVSQFSLIAIATFVGVTVDGFPSTRTISNAIATAAQSVQLAYATAPFVWSTTSPMTCRIAKATLKTVVPSFVLTAIAALSPACAALGALAMPKSANSATNTSVRSRLLISTSSRRCGRGRSDRCRNRYAVRRCLCGRRFGGGSGGRRLVLGRLVRLGRRGARLLVRRRCVDAAVRADEGRSAELLLALRGQRRPACRDLLELLDRALQRPLLTRLDRPVFPVRPPEVAQEGEHACSQHEERAARDGLLLGSGP